jgi:hypothetical protein
MPRQLRRGVTVRELLSTALVSGRVGRHRPYGAAQRGSTPPKWKAKFRSVVPDWLGYAARQRNRDSVADDLQT